MSSKAWNEEMLNDAEVLAHLEELSEGKINITEETDIQFKQMQQRKIAKPQENFGGTGNFRNNKHKNKNRNKTKTSLFNHPPSLNTGNCCGATRPCPAGHAELLRTITNTARSRTP